MDQAHLGPSGLGHLELLLPFGKAVATPQGKATGLHRSPLERAAQTQGPCPLTPLDGLATAQGRPGASARLDQAGCAARPGRHPAAETLAVET